MSEKMGSDRFSCRRFDSRCMMLIMVVVGLISGCGETVPDVVPLTVSVTKAGGKPLNAVRVRFVPMLESLDGNFNASGVTDDEGICIIKLPGKSESSITVGEHKVQINEAGISNEAQKAYMKGDSSVSKKEKRNRKNRPLPKKYERVSSTPLKYDISPDQARIDIVLE